MLYTESVKTFLRNPFQSPLSALVAEITPSSQENATVQKATEFLKEMMTQVQKEGGFPNLAPEVVLVVGSHFRQTDLSPIEHIDIFLLFDPQLVEINEKESTLSVKNKEPLFSSSADASMHLLPLKMVSYVEAVLSKKFPTTLTQSKQAVEIRLEQFSLKVRVTPAFSSGDCFYIPEERTELLWRKVSPQKEKEILEKVNLRHNNTLIPLIRYIKLWNETKNNESFRNYHIEAIAYFIFEEIPTPVKSLREALDQYVKSMSRYIYNCPDPTQLSLPIHSYLPDNIDQWYLYMNRISDLKAAIALNEKSIVDLVNPQMV